jgi:predicted DNA-binding protein
MRTKKRLHPYVSPELAHRLESYCAAKGITESAFVQEAIEERLKGEPKDVDLLLRRLDRQDRALAAQYRDQAVLTEAFGFFVRTWLALQPPMVEPDKHAGERLGAKRYAHFVEYVSMQVATGRAFATDVANAPREKVSAGASPTSPAPGPRAGR